MTKEQAVILCNTLCQKGSVQTLLKFVGMQFIIRKYKSPTEDHYESDCKLVASNLRQIADALEQ